MNYYNEFDPKTAAWLRELIKAKLIPAGEVDERSIELVQPGDLDGFTQCHFFAGIGGWSYALYLAGWPEEREVWTGSCPCQPLSCAGLGKGHADKRHLWPYFQRLIAKRKPSAVFGEQVASKLGREWLAGIRADLEGIRYAVGASDLCAAGVGSPHIRQRLFWVANSQDTNGRSEFEPGESTEHGGGGRFTRDCKARIALGDTISEGLEGQSGNVSSRSEPGRDTAQSDRPTAEASGDVRLDNSECVGFRSSGHCDGKDDGIITGPTEQASDGMVNTNGEGSQSRESSTAPAGHGNSVESTSSNERLSNTDGEQINPSHSKGFFTQPPGGNAWGDYELLHFIDGKTRRIKSGVKPLAHGVSARVVKLRGIGNAICPQIAAEFIKAYLEIE